MVTTALPPAVRQSCRLNSTFAPGLRPTAHFFTTSITKRSLLSRAILPSLQSHSPRLASSKLSILSATPPPPTSTPSSFFTPSLCRQRHASTTAQPTSDPTPATSAGTSNPPPSSVVLDWNTFFRLRKTRRRFSLFSSLVSSMASTGGAFVVLSSFPEAADQITKVIPTDPFISLGIATVGAMLLGWLVGPIFGNGLWRLVNRTTLPEFTIKERAFFDRIKKHRVNPAGASTNNPVPDFYGEKIGSVEGYRRWLKDQRAFNRKRGATFVV